MCEGCGISGLLVIWMFLVWCIVFVGIWFVIVDSVGLPLTSESTGLYSVLNSGQVLVVAGDWQSSCESLLAFSMHKPLGRLAVTRISRPLVLYIHMVRPVWESLTVIVVHCLTLRPTNTWAFSGYVD